MKKLTLIVMAIALSFAVFHSCNEPLTEDPISDELSLKSASVAKSYIVVLNDAELDTELSNLKGYEMRQQAAQNAAERIMNRAGITDGELGFVYGTAIKGFSVKIPPGQLKKLENDPSVKYVEEDKLVSLVEPESLKVHGTVGTQSVPWGVARVKGGASYTGNGVAWVLDTGIDQDHPDLNVDTQRSMSVFTTGRDQSPNDGHGHGTHVAGTIAAKGTSIVGVAAGATVVAVKVLDSRGSGSTSGVIAGVDYVKAKAASIDVANMSLGGGVSTTLDNAVLSASIICKFSLAAGNESDDADNHSPARTGGDENIFTISAMAQGDNWASYSNYGNPPVDFCEPGSSIYSTYKDGKYATMSGTSMAAPHMAGILLWGAPVTDGTVNNDPDKNPDPIGVVGGTEVASVSINPESAEGNQDIGSPITYSFIITNSGDVGDTYDISLSSTWNSSSDKTTLTLIAGQSETVNITHTVLSNASPGDSDTGTLNISSSTTSASASATFTTTAKGYAVHVTPESQIGTGAAGNIVSYVYTISNAGTENDTYNLSTSSSWTSSVNLSSVAVNAGSSADVTVSHTIPDGANDGTSDIGSLTVQSAGDAYISTSAEFATTSKTASESVPPVIKSYTLTDNSNPAWTRATVDWTVSDGDGDLESVTTTMKNSNGEVIDSVTSSVSGSSALGTHEVGVRGGGVSYTVTLTVKDSNNNEHTKVLE